MRLDPVGTKRVFRWLPRSTMGTSLGARVQEYGLRRGKQPTPKFRLREAGSWKRKRRKKGARGTEREVEATRDCDGEQTRSAEASSPAITMGKLVFRAVVSGPASGSAHSGFRFDAEYCKQGCRNERETKSEKKCEKSREKEGEREWRRKEEAAGEVAKDAQISAQCGTSLAMEYGRARGRPPWKRNGRDNNTQPCGIQLLLEISASEGNAFTGSRQPSASRAEEHSSPWKDE